MRRCVSVYTRRYITYTVATIATIVLCPLKVFEYFVCVLWANLFDDNMMISPVLRSLGVSSHTKLQHTRIRTENFAPTIKIQMEKAQTKENEVGVARSFFLPILRTLKAKW